MTTLLIDSNAVCHRARHAMKGSQLSHEEMRTEVIFSFMNQIFTLAERFNTNKFVFAWDSRESKRRKIYPAYKKRDKEKTPEDIEFDNLTLPQFDRIRCEVLPALGFSNQFMKEGYEADDVIAALVMKHKGQFTIVSRDNDLYQLLFFASMYDPQTKRMMDKNSFYSHYGILPSKWSLVKAIAGCKSDNIKGVDRVGDITALKYLKGQLKEDAKLFIAINNSEKLVDFNIKLVRLPFDGMTDNFILSEDALSARKFFETFSQFGFKTFTGSEFKDWERLFKLH